MPLSEEELRLLDQMERALVADDPKLASTLRGTTLRAAARRRAIIAGVVFVLGIAVLMTGAVLHQVIVAVAGFLIMLGSSYVALTAWRGQNHPPERPTGAPGRGSRSFSVIEGGRSKRPGRAPRPPRSHGPSSSHGSMMERFEERWRRRRDQNGQSGF